eukprot:g490.t1
MIFRDDEDMSFDDVFGVDEMELTPIETSSDTPATAVSVHETTPVSALTLKFEGMKVEPEIQDTVLPDIESKWTELRHYREDTVPRMGSSAPVWIPQPRMDWTETHQLYKIREEDECEQTNKRVDGFIPPHLTVERPLIQFSLNSGIAEKRAQFRTREKILTMLGVNESCDACFAETSEYHHTIRSSETGGLTRNFTSTQKAA